MFLIADARFRCDVCNTERPSKDIGVKKHRHIGPTGVEFVENVKFCKDKMECESAATTFGLTHLQLLANTGQMNVMAEMLRDKALDANLSIKRFWHGLAFGLALGGTIVWNISMGTFG